MSKATAERTLIRCLRCTGGQQPCRRGSLWDLAERYALSVYDALIAAAAMHAECDLLWSKDLQHGMVVGERLRVADPFHAA